MLPSLPGKAVSDRRTLTLVIRSHRDPHNPDAKSDRRENFKQDLGWEHADILSRSARKGTGDAIAVSFQTCD